jgi:hypothetical protein
VCMCVSVCAWTCIYIDANTFTHSHSHLHIYSCGIFSGRRQIPVKESTNRQHTVHALTRTHTCTKVQTHAHMVTHTHTHTHKLSHTHTQTHTHTPGLRLRQAAALASRRHNGHARRARLLGQWAGAGVGMCIDAWCR